MEFEESRGKSFDLDALSGALRMWYWWRVVDRVQGENAKLHRIAEIWQEEAVEIIAIAAELETTLVFLSGKPGIFQQIFRTNERDLTNPPITNGAYDLNIDLMRRFLVSDN